MDDFPYDLEQAESQGFGAGVWSTGSSSAVWLARSASGYEGVWRAQAGIKLSAKWILGDEVFSFEASGPMAASLEASGATREEMSRRAFALLGAAAMRESESSLFSRSDVDAVIGALDQRWGLQRALAPSAKALFEKARALALGMDADAGYRARSEKPSA